MIPIGRTQHREAGYTLVEMLVTIIMFTLITGSITTVVITSMKHQNSLAERGSVLANARNTLEQIDRDLRSANPICAATGTEVTMLETPVTATSTTTWIVDYQLQGTSLVYTKFATSGTPAPGATLVCNETVQTGFTSTTVPIYEQGAAVSTRRVLFNVVNGATPIFTIPPTTGTFNNCMTGGTAPTSATAMSSITALTVTVSIKTANLTSAVTATDCGTYLRNSIAPTN